MIEVKDLVFSYEKGRKALKGLDFEVEKERYSASSAQTVRGSPQPRRSLPVFREAIRGK